MVSIFLFILPGLVLASSMDSTGDLKDVNFVHKVTLDQFGSFVMMWTPLEDQIIIEIQVRSLGYVGLGFSPTGRMAGADIVIAWIADDGAIHFSDRHASGNRTPVEDESQDYELLGGFRNDTHTVVRFSRPWISCDEKNDFVITEDTVRLIWAYDDLQPDQSKVPMRYHDHRGTKSLYLKEKKMANLPPAEDTHHWDIRSPDVDISGHLHTLYWCKLYKIPDLPWKHQLIGYLPLIKEESVVHVHHMLLYECTIPNSQEYFEKWVQEKGAQCYSSNMPISWTACGTPIIAWAIGSQGEMLPEHVGFPLGEKQGGATYFLLEIHYDNPELKKGLADNSGLRLLLTDKLRPNDAGVLTLGHKVEPSMIIPPGKVWSITGHCTADCTRKTIPAEGINVFSAILHAHLLGSGISVKHIRNGEELEPLVVDNAYDFNYQQARFLAKEVSVKPGDHLITTCIYNASQRTGATFGGFGTEEEMCLAFMIYYPRLNLGECYSQPDIALLFDVFGIQNLYDIDKIMRIFDQKGFDVLDLDQEKEAENMKEMAGLETSGGNAAGFRLADFFRGILISEPEGMRGSSFYSILTKEETWKDRNLIHKLDEAVSNLPYEPSCLYSGRRVVEGLPKKAKIPQYIPYRPKKANCLRITEGRNGIHGLSAFQDPTYGYSSSRDKGKTAREGNEQSSSLKGSRSGAKSFSSSVALILFALVIL